MDSNIFLGCMTARECLLGPCRHSHINGLSNTSTINFVKIVIQQLVHLHTTVHITVHVQYGNIHAVSYKHISNSVTKFLLSYIVRL